jgi:hypothetical protein
MQNRGLPHLFAAISVALLLLIVIVSLLLLLSAPLAYWLGQAGHIGGLIREKLRTSVNRWRWCRSCSCSCRWE